MGADIPRHEPYPNPVSRSLDEGGYTFLHRVFNTSRTTGEPVTINTGSLHIQYQYIPGQTSFVEGLTLLDGQDADTMSRFMEVASSFDIAIAQAQAEAANQAQKKPSIFKFPWKNK